MLTVAAVKSLQPKAEKYDHMDPDHPGFGVRVMPSGAKTFMFRYRIGGRGGALRRMMLGGADTLTLKEARGLYLEARKVLELGADPLDAREDARRQAEQELTLAALADRYLNEYASLKRSGAEDRRIVEHDVLPAWGKRKAKDIKKRDVVALLDGIIGRGAPTQANRTFACIRKMYAWAGEKDLVESNPCAGIKAPSKEQARDRVLTNDELRAFWSLPGLSPRVQAALRLQLVLGQRVGEILGLRWSEIDLQERLWTLPAERAKNGMVHTIPLTDTAIQILADMHVLRRDGEDHVFPVRTRADGEAPKADHLRVDSIGSMLTRAIAAAGLVHFTAHDLRRTAATRISATGTSREVLRQILNHKDNSVTARYDRHRYDDEKRAALEGWERALIAILAGENAPSNVVPLFGGAAAA